MATTGRSGLAHVVLRSVAERVVRHATWPVLTVRHDAAATPVTQTAGALPQVQRILVPPDGSALAEALLPRLVTLATRHGAALTLLHVTHAHALHEIDLVEKQVRVVREAEAYLAGVARRLAVDGVGTTPVARYGGTPAEILDDIRSRRPDLVAMGDERPHRAHAARPGECRQAGAACFACAGPAVPGPGAPCDCC